MNGVRTDGGVCLLVCLLVTAVGVGVTGATPGPDGASAALGEHSERRVGGAFEVDRHEVATRSRDASDATLREPEWLDVATAPRSARAELDSAANLSRARSAGRLTTDSTLVPGDVLVLTLELSGADDRVAAASGDTLTERFFAVTDERKGLQLRQVEASQMREPLALFLNDSAATTVVRTNATDTYALVTRPAALPGVGAFGEPYRYANATHDVRLDRDAGYAVIVDAGPWNRRTVHQNGAIAAVVELARPDASIGGPPRTHRFLATPNASVPLVVHTPYAPGTLVRATVYQRSDGGESLRFTGQVTRREAGAKRSWQSEAGRHHVARLALDLSSLSDGTTFTLSVDLGNTTAALGGQTYARSGTLSLPDPVTVENSSLPVETTTAADAGDFLVVGIGDGPRPRPNDTRFVLARSVSSVDDGPTGALELRQPAVERLQSAGTDRLTAYLVADANGNGEYDARDLPYLDDGRPIRATARFRVADSAATDTATTPGSEQSGSDEGSPTSTSPSTTTGGSGPLQPATLLAVVGFVSLVGFLLRR